MRQARKWQVSIMLSVGCWSFTFWQQLRLYMFRAVHLINYASQCFESKPRPFPRGAGALPIRSPRPVTLIAGCDRVEMCMTNDQVGTYILLISRLSVGIHRYVIQNHIILYTHSDTSTWTHRHMCVRVSMGSLCHWIVAWCTLREQHRSQNCDNRPYQIS